MQYICIASMEQLYYKDVDENNLNNIPKVRNILRCTCKEMNLKISWSTRTGEKHPQLLLIGRAKRSNTDFRPAANYS
jgi:hypothetical protein